MSKSDFDLELHFLPAWAQESQDPNRYANYRGDTPRENRDGRRGDSRRPPGQGQGSRPRGDFPRPRPDQQNKRPGPGQGQGSRPDRSQRSGPDRSGPPRDRERERERELPPLLELNVAFKPDEKGVESLARQIRMTGRAYPLFDIAQMILRKPERHSIILTVKKKPDNQPIQPLFACALDNTVHLSEEEAVRYVLQKHFATFYQAEKTKIDGPKGTYTFVAQCGLSGVILGPPNHHDYQTQLHKLHTSRFSRMPFEAFKARVKIVRDEAVVKQWIDEQSWKTEYVCLNMPEPLQLGSRDEVQKHFRETHFPNIIQEVQSFEMSGAATREIKSPTLLRLVRHHWEHQKRFPLQIATVLSQQFATHGLQFFKVNKTVTHVAVARPHHLDLDAAPVSDGVKNIVLYVEHHPQCTRRQLLEALAPRPKTPLPAAATPTSPSPSTPSSSPPADTPQAPAPEASDSTPKAAATPPPQPEPTPEETAVVADLHWVIHQGHVIEFANGLLETAKKPAPKPERKPRPVNLTPNKPGSPSTDTPESSESSSMETGPQNRPTSSTESDLSSESAQVAAPESANPAPGSSASPSPSEPISTEPRLAETEEMTPPMNSTTPTTPEAIPPDSQAGQVDPPKAP